MPYKNIEDQKRYRKEYYQKHREEAIKSVAEWRKKDDNKERRNKTERERNFIRLRTDKKFRERRKEYCRNSYRKFIAKRLLLAKKSNKTFEAKARNILRNAIRRGEIIRPQTCDICRLKSKNIQAHHPNYLKPLFVIWLCSLCHGEIHRK